MAAAGQFACPVDWPADQQMSPIEVRAALRQLAARDNVSLAELSRVVGRNPAYIQQFLERGSPERLPEDERLALARFFNVDERLLGARDPWSPG